MSADIVRVDAIRVEDRARVEYRNIDSLAGSIETVGLLHPPVVTPDLRLIAGGRRLEAVKALGWEKVPVTVISNLTHAAELMQAESDENTEREALTLSEAAAFAWQIEEALAPLRERERRAKISDARADGANFAPSQPAPKTRDIAAQAAGVSHETIRKVRHVEEVIESEETPEPVREVAVQALADMNATGKADAGYKRVLAAQQPVASGIEANRINAIQAAKAVGSALETLLGLTYQNYRTGIVDDWWPIGKEDVPPAQAELFTPENLRHIAQGLVDTAVELEALHV